MSSAEPDPTAPRRGRPPADDAARAAVRAQILDAAEAELAERGPGALRVDAVAARAGVARATVYRHIDGRDGLVTAIVLRRLETLSADVLGAVAGAATLADAVRVCVQTVIGAVADDPLLARIVTLGPPTHPNPDSAVAAQVAGLARTFLADLPATHRAELRNGMSDTDFGITVLRTIQVLAPHAERFRGDDLDAWLDRTLLAGILADRPPLD